MRVVISQSLGTNNTKQHRKIHNSINLNN